MANAIHVARYLLKLAGEESEPELVTHLRLQKLLYYVQGWSLAIRGQAFFDGAIEAWTNGPVVRQAYPAFADYGNQPIPFREAEDCRATLTDEQRAFVASIWEGYKQYSAIQLRRMTHNEAPWRETRGDLGADERSDTEIPHSVMRAFFQDVYRSHQIPGLELETLEAADRELREGRGVELGVLRDAV